ncbi:hypothetical protein [Modestobacter caceresii]|uniref:hypothetical protein n=1 Tax=Modestobacter caceresii TaxID=1522368 RepID=UPI000691D95B|nr:hypothetical protein [Modestobacter caceresii]
MLLALVPRPDNNYDSRAIAVTAPPSHGGDVFERHLGYLYSKWLHHMAPLITDLTTHSPVPAGCHGYIELHELHEWDDPEVEDEPWTPTTDSPLTPAEEAALGYRMGTLRLQWAWSDDLKPVISEYIDDKIRKEHAGGPAADAGRGLAETEVRQAHLARRDTRLRTAQAAQATTNNARSQARAARDAAAVAQNAIWATWRREPHGRHGITAVSSGIFGSRHVLLLDGQAAEIGQWHVPHGPLTLVDERLRAAALGALEAHGISRHSSPDLDDLADFPNATVSIRESSWSVRVIEADHAPDQLREIARYDLATEVVMVYARPHREPVQTLLRRHGVDADTVWSIDPPVKSDRQDPTDLERGTQPVQLRLRNRVRGHLPPEHAEVLGIQWGKLGASIHRSTHKELRANTYYLRELGTLLGVNAATLRPARCRLCHNNALASPDGLAYCFACVRWAQGRWLRDNGTDGPWIESVVWALRRVVELEFSGPPSVAQLNRLHVSDPDIADAAMLCRFLIPRPALATLRARSYGTARSWAQWLHLADLLEGGLRTSRGTITVATDGHPCRSMLERHVDDFLHHSGIAHDIEPAYPRHPDLNTTGLRADWLLHDSTYVEALGMPDEPAYAAKVARKRELARHTGIPLLTLTAEDLNRLPEIFAAWLPAAPATGGATTPAPF